MMARVICHGCGQKVEVPAGHVRKKLRCPDCGVLNEVPDDVLAAAQTAQPPRKAQPGPPPPAPPREAADAALDEAFFTDDPAPSAPGVCPGCGEPTASEGQFCEACQTSAVRTRPGPPPPRPAKPLLPVETLQPDYSHSQEDDGKPYALDGGMDLKCPGCGRGVPRQQSVCLKCGYNFKTGQKAVKTYDPVVRHWESGLPFAGRVGLFLGLQALSIGGSVIVLSTGALGPLAAIGSALLFAGMTAFVIGTQDSLDLTRDRKGEVELTKRWRIGFVPLAPTTVDVKTYEGIITNSQRDNSALDVAVLVMLFALGALPGIVWYFCVFNRDVFYCALTRHHGYPELVLYRGLSERYMKEIATTIRNVAGLNLERV